MGKPKKLPKEAIVAGQAFSITVISALIHIPFHEFGHYVGGRLAGASDVEYGYNACHSDKIDDFPNYRRFLFSFGGPLFTHILISLGYYALKQRNLQLKLLGLSLTMPLINCVVDTRHHLYIKYIKKRKPYTDQTLMAEKLGVPAEVVLLVESVLDLFLLQKSWRLIPGNKLLTYSACFFACVVAYLYYYFQLGPKLIGEAPGVKRRNFKKLSEG